MESEGMNHSLDLDVDDAVDRSMELNAASPSLEESDNVSRSMASDGATPGNDSTMIKSKSRGGIKRGTKLNPLPLSLWYEVCANYVKNYPSMKQADFLRSDVSGPQVNLVHKMSFSRRLRDYRNGTLKPSDNYKANKVRYPKVEEKLVQFLKLRQELYKLDKRVGVSWQQLAQKCLEWAAEEEDPIYRNFMASPGFIEKVLKRNNFDGISLDGESNKNSNSEVSAQKAVAAAASEAQRQMPMHSVEDIKETNLNHGTDPNLFRSLSEAQEQIARLQNYGVSLGLKNKDLRHLDQYSHALQRVCYAPKQENIHPV